MPILLPNQQSRSTKGNSISYITYMLKFWLFVWCIFRVTVRKLQCTIAFTCHEAGGSVGRGILSVCEFVSCCVSRFIPMKDTEFAVVKQMNISRRSSLASFRRICSFSGGTKVFQLTSHVTHQWKEMPQNRVLCCRHYVMWHSFWYFVSYPALPVITVMIV